MLDRSDVLSRKAAAEAANDGTLVKLCEAYLQMLEAPAVMPTCILSTTRAEITASTPVWADWSEEGKHYLLMPTVS